MRWLSGFGLLMLLAACVPADVPPQLAYTPGPTVRVADNTVETDQFSAWLPPGWKLVTSAASSPQAVMIIAPDEDALIMLGGDGAQTPVLQVDGEVSTVQRRVTLDNSTSVIAVLLTGAGHKALYLPVFEQVVNSLHPTRNDEDVTN